MKNRTSKKVTLSIGLDLGDRSSFVVGVTRDGEIVCEEKIATSGDAFHEFFSSVDPDARIVCEAGTHSPWVSALLESLELDVVVANPSHAGRALAANGRKNDRLDALTLATMGLDSVALLRRIRHRGATAQADLAIIRARCSVVAARTLLINAVRGLVKSSGARLPSCSSDAFARKVSAAVPEALEPAVGPMIEQVGTLTATVREYDKRIEELCKRYPDAKRLREIKGVGPITSVAFVLTIDDPKRFRRSRDVGAYLGLVPRQFESGNSSPQLRISKAGDKYLRQLLVSCAHYILGPHGEDSRLRRFGERVGARGGKKGKKRAAVAVARKLSVIMHRLIFTAERYDPFYSPAQRACA